MNLPKKIEYDARGLGGTGGLFEIILLAVHIIILTVFGRDHSRSRTTGLTLASSSSDVTLLPTPVMDTTLSRVTHSPAGDAENPGFSLIIDLLQSVGPDVRISLRVRLGERGYIGALFCRTALISGQNVGAAIQTNVVESDEIEM